MPVSSNMMHIFQQLDLIIINQESHQWNKVYPKLQNTLQISKWNSSYQSFNFFMQNEWLNYSTFIMTSRTIYHQRLEISWDKSSCDYYRHWSTIALILLLLVLLISSCDQVCNISQFASVPEGKLRIYDYDEGFEENSFDLFHGDKEEGISWRYSC